MEKAYHGSKTISESIREEQDRLASLQDQISFSLHGIMRRTRPSENWEHDIRELKQLRERLQEGINRDEVALAALDVAAVD